MTKASQGPSEHDIAIAVLADIGNDAVIDVADRIFMWNKCGLWSSVEKTLLRQKVLKSIKSCFPSMPVRNSLVKAVTELIVTSVHKPAHQFNVGPAEMVNLRNAELHLDNGSWSSKHHDLKNYSTVQIPHLYDPQAKAPRFEQFLLEVFDGDSDRDEKVLCIYEMIGYSLLRHCRLEIFLLLIGSGANGKSVLLNALKFVLGQENVAAVQPRYFSSPYQRAHLADKLANIVTEIERGHVLPEADLKALVSGESMTVENKHKSPFVLSPFATQWFGTNHMPSTVDVSEALYRRAIIIEFNNTFSAGDADPNLIDKLQCESSGIIAKSMEAYGNVVRRNYKITVPRSSIVLMDEWKLQNDPAGTFIVKECSRTPGSRIGSSELYKRFQIWASGVGVVDNISQKAFSQRLAQMGIVTRATNTGAVFVGLSV